jgi:hypothetical protein
VLEQQDRGRGVGLELGTEVLDVLVGQQAVGLLDMRMERRAGRVVQLGELDADDVAVRALRDEDQVDHPDHLALHELGERRRDLARELVAGEPDHQDLDRSDVHAVLLLGAQRAALSHVPATCHRSIRG